MQKNELAVIIETDDEADLNTVAAEAYSNAQEKGFWDEIEGKQDLDYDRAEVAVLASKLALIHSEVSEALEELRETEVHMLKETRIVDGKPEGFGAELADIVIRVADLAYRTNVNLGAMVKFKMRYNRSRPKMHGDKKL